MLEMFLWLVGITVLLAYAQYLKHQLLRYVT